MRVQAWKSRYNYIVALDDDLYEMSDNANMPNGVCIYIGGATEQSQDAAYGMPMEWLPMGIVRQIANLAVETGMEEARRAVGLAIADRHRGE